MRLVSSRSLLVAALAALAAACGGAVATAPSPSSAPTAPSPSVPTSSALATSSVDDGELAAALARETPRPACLVVAQPGGAVRQSSARACAERRLPMSTFKLPNALIAADLGLVDGPESVLPYDAARYPAQADWFAGWDRPQPLAAALAISAVPLFRGLATRIGAEKMRAYLSRLEYGNATFGDDLDHFWLDGALAISALEQVRFLSRLVAGALPVSARAQEIVRQAIQSEQLGPATIRWKTGTGRSAGRWVAWLVGWIERPEGVYPFACRIDDERADFEVVRTERTRVCRGALTALGLLPAAAH